MNNNQEAVYDDFENNPNVKALQEFRRKPFETAERCPTQKYECYKKLIRNLRKQQEGKNDAIDNQ